jgi:MoxR-like ATPase
MEAGRMTNQTNIDYTYSGDQKYQPTADGLRDPDGREYFPYLPEPGLKKALNLAIALRRPLLLEGEPGCGKTRVASALAYELTCRKLGDQHPKPKERTDWWNFYIWNVTSTSRAQDGLYTFDAVARLRDAQLIGSGPEQLKKYLGEKEVNALESRLKDKTKYREFGALGQALREQTYRPVLLIDEVDKADSDFPNDLLLELDELRFTIADTNENIGPPDADNKPIILITSNREKPLPEPFLRRCLYYYVPFPKEDILRNIIEARFGQRVAQKEELVNLALQKFDMVYNLLKRQPGSRPPGTSELLEFLTALIQEHRTVEDAITDLENLAGELPLLGTLIKTKADQDLYVKTYPKNSEG